VNVATTSGLITVKELWDLPERAGCRYELHHGELILVSTPKWKHVLLQWRLRDLLKVLLASFGYVETEVPFRPLPEHELWAADGAFVTRERYAAVDRNDALVGAPDIAIEVLSPSNTVTEMAERCALCLENGALQFWTVDDRLREIKVSTPDGLTRTYKSGDSIPLLFADNQSLAVDSVFAE
jgi:Uma2 family endonuclease